MKPLTEEQKQLQRKIESKLNAGFKPHVLSIGFYHEGQWRGEVNTAEVLRLALAAPELSAEQEPFANVKINLANATLRHFRKVGFERFSEMCFSNEMPEVMGITCALSDLSPSEGRTPDRRKCERRNPNHFSYYSRINRRECSDRRKAAAPAEKAPHERMDATARKRFIEQCEDKALKPCVDGSLFAFRNQHGGIVGSYWPSELGRWVAASPAPAAVEPEQRQVPKRFDDKLTEFSPRGLLQAMCVIFRATGSTEEPRISKIINEIIRRLEAAVEPPSAPVVDADRKAIERSIKVFRINCGDRFKEGPLAEAMKCVIDAYDAGELIAAPAPAQSALQVAEHHLSNFAMTMREEPGFGMYSTPVPEQFKRLRDDVRALRPKAEPTPAELMQNEEIAEAVRVLVDAGFTGESYEQALRLVPADKEEA